ncbi:MAG: hypothetical protein K2G83_07530 [Ruminococcus sp.]|nr:hypothetical protein [Ruminococcus sp.]
MNKNFNCKTRYPIFLIHGMRFSSESPQNKNEISDITEFYINLVSELKVMGC